MSLLSEYVAPVAVTLTVIGPVAAGGYKWLRAVSGAVHQLTEVVKQLGAISETQTEQGRQIRAVRRELALHVRECGGPRRARALPAPRPVLEEPV